MLFRASVLALGLGTAFSSHAAVLTFEGLSTKVNFGTYVTYNSPLSTGGYTFTSTSEYGTWTTTSDANTSFSNYTGSVALFENQGENTTLTRDAGAFDLLSLDIANAYRQGQSGTNALTFTGTFAGGGTVTQLFTIPSDNSLHTISFVGFTNLSSVVFSSPGNSYQFDNVTVEAVPEPASMVALSIGALALLRRRKRV